jgi:hypothetical protein
MQAGMKDGSNFSKIKGTTTLEDLRQAEAEQILSAAVAGLNGVSDSRVHDKDIKSRTIYPSRWLSTSFSSHLTGYDNFGVNTHSSTNLDQARTRVFELKSNRLKPSGYVYYTAWAEKGFETEPEIEQIFGFVQIYDEIKLIVGIKPDGEHPYSVAYIRRGDAFQFEDALHVNEVTRIKTGSSLQQRLGSNEFKFPLSVKIEDIPAHVNQESGLLFDVTGTQNLKALETLSIGKSTADKEKTHLHSHPAGLSVSEEATVRRLLKDEQKMEQSDLPFPVSDQVPVKRIVPIVSNSNYRLQLQEPILKDTGTKLINMVTSHFLERYNEGSPAFISKQGTIELFLFGLLTEKHLKKITTLGRAKLKLKIPPYGILKFDRERVGMQDSSYFLTKAEQIGEEINNEHSQWIGALLFNYIDVSEGDNAPTGRFYTAANRFEEKHNDVRFTEFLFKQVFGFVSVRDKKFFVVLTKDVIESTRGQISTIVYSVENNQLSLTDHIYMNGSKLDIRESDGSVAYIISGSNLFYFPKTLTYEELLKRVDKSGLLFYSQLKIADSLITNESIRPKE